MQKKNKEGVAMDIGIKSYIQKLKYEVYIYYVDMPCSVASNLAQNPDGSYTLYLNSRLTCEKQLKGFLHELRHLENNDFDNKNINYIECMNHLDD